MSQGPTASTGTSKYRSREGEAGTHVNPLMAGRDRLRLNLRRAGFELTEWTTGPFLGVNLNDHVHPRSGLFYISCNQKNTTRWGFRHGVCLERRSNPRQG